MNLDPTKYKFAGFVLEKVDSDRWRLLDGSEEVTELSPLHTNVLAKLLERGEKGVNEIQLKNLIGNNPGTKVIQKIREVLKEEITKKNGRRIFKLIQPDYKRGYIWVHSDVRVYAKGTLLLSSVRVEGYESDVKKNLSFEQSVAGLIQETFNFEITVAEDTDLVSPENFHCFIQGHCLFEKGDYRLVLVIFRHAGKSGRKNVEIEGNKFLTLIDDAKLKIIQALKEIFPEVVREEGKLPETNRANVKDFVPQNNEATEYYLKGEHLWYRRDQASVVQGLTFFEKAVAVDPEFFPALIGIAKSYVILCLQGSEMLSPKKAIPKAIKALEKISGSKKSNLLSYESLSEIEAIQALISFIYEWDPAKAFNSFERSLGLMPSNYMARTWYGQCLARVGNFEKAKAEIEIARSYSGFTLPVVNTSYIQTLYISRNYEEAISSAKEALELNPGLRLGHLFYGLAARGIDDLETALAHLRTAYELMPNSAVIAELGYTYGIAGQKAEAEEMRRKLNKIRGKGDYASHYNDAKICSGLSLFDECMNELDKAYEERSPWLTQLSIDPPFDRLRANPRYKSFIFRFAKFFSS